MIEAISFILFYSHSIERWKTESDQVRGFESEWTASRLGKMSMVFWRLSVLPLSNRTNWSQMALRMSLQFIAMGYLSQVMLMPINSATGAMIGTMMKQISTKSMKKPKSKYNMVMIKSPTSHLAAATSTLQPDNHHQCISKRHRECHPRTQQEIAEYMR